MIFINGRFLTQKITGVQRFGIEVLKELDSLVPKGTIEVLSPPGIINKVKLNNIIIRTIGKKSNNFWTQITFPVYVLRHHGTGLTMAGLCPVIKPDYFVAHDITFIRHPESFSKAFRLSYIACYFASLNRCKKIFTVSEFSKREISKTIHVPESKFIVVSPSSGHLKASVYSEIDLGKFGIKGDKYYLSVSSQNKHKNQNYIMDLAKLNPDKKFVIVGGAKIKSFNQISYDSLDNVILTGYVSNDELYTLYKYAEGFIFPSLYEGFGLPPLEAITMGVKRVAVSKIPVFEEIYDKDVYYFDPLTPKTFDFETFNAIQISDEDRVTYLEDHNWKKTASQILSTVKKNEGN